MPNFPSASNDIPPDIAPHIIGWARIPPAKAWKHPGGEKEWTPVLAMDPSNPGRAAMTDYAWLYRHGRIIETHVRAYEIVTGNERPTDRR